MHACAWGVRELARLGSVHKCKPGGLVCKWSLEKLGGCAGEVSRAIADEAYRR